ncbi:MAG TPA: hypothetical protein VMA35_12505 [Candidatus Sulfopaludibacter sp.]|nr:hypothetical protein [Candidatus Sulfopaludibacter sp.]
MTVRTRNRLITFSILAGPFIFLFCLLFFWEAEPLPPVPPLPNPNGYDDLVKAGEMIKGDVGNYDEMGQAELLAMTQTNSGALQLARTGLQKASRVPSRFSQDYMESHISDVTALKRLAQAWGIEGRLAALENHPEDAAKSYLEIIHLGNESAYGGVLVDAMIGIAMESLGAEHLQELVDQLDARSCRETAARLDVLDSQRQTWDQVRQQERDWSRRTFRGTRYELVRLMERSVTEKIFQSAGQSYQKQVGITRQLIIEFAARAYELEKGHRPANLNDLVPNYLKAIPKDPVTGRELNWN